MNKIELAKTHKLMKDAVAADLQPMPNQNWRLFPSKPCNPDDANEKIVRLSR